jgi:hypothetical protein
MAAIHEQYILLDIPTNNISVVDVQAEDDIKIDIPIDAAMNDLVKNMLSCFCKFHHLEPLEEYKQKLKNAMDKGLDITVLIAEKDTFGADKIKMLLEMY